MKVTDLYARGATVWVWISPTSSSFWSCSAPWPCRPFSELPGGAQLDKGLYWAAGLAAFGVVLNRFNVSLTSYVGYRQFGYFPSAIEIIITLALVAGGILIFDLGTRYLPVYQSELSGKTS